MTKKQIAEAQVKPRCPHCESTQVYYRLNSDDYQCRRCGKSFEKPKGA